MWVVKGHIFSWAKQGRDGRRDGRRDVRREGSPLRVWDLARVERARQYREKQKKAAMKR